MDLHETYLAHRAEIAAQVTAAAEREPILATERLSLATTIQVRDNGSVTIRQPGGSITLTQSQAADLMNRIAVAVLRTQAEGMRS